jgi:uncharacterized membrane protein YeaQ/YmgE (transglycosylase-associated protein family)
MILKLTTQRSWAYTILAFALLFVGLTGLERLQAGETVSDQVGAAASAAEKTLQEAGQTGIAWSAELWRRVDEKRLQNRTPDQIVAWVIMGLLVGGLIHQFGKLNRVVTLLLGLVGAFFGGIIANVVQFDLGLGPVLIRYEELLASLVGGLLIFLILRLLGARKRAKA